MRATKKVHYPGRYGYMQLKYISGELQYTNAKMLLLYGEKQHSIWIVF